MSEAAWIIGLVAAVLGLGAGLWFAPTLILAASLRIVPRLLGLRRDRLGGWPTLSAPTRGGGDQAPTLVVIHGLGVRKETMLSLVAGLRGGRRVVALDLPGFGEHRLPAAFAERPPGQRSFAEVRARSLGASGEAYLALIESWLEVVVREPVDLLGASMGGAIAAWLAARRPDLARRLVLLGPAGIRAPRVNAFMREVESDRNPLEIRTVADLDRVIGLNFVRPPSIPWVVRAALARDLRARQAAQEAVVDAIGPLLLDGLRTELPRVQARTLVLWGGEDAILDPSAAEVFAALLPHGTVEVVPDAGHTLHGDRPREVIARIDEFLRAT